MSGFEALSLACCVFQTISFAHETAVACRDIYHGQKTPDSMLEEKAIAMIEVAQQVEASCRGINTPEEQCLADTAEKCTTTATQLAAEVAKITKLHKKGRIYAAGRARLRSLWKKKEIDDLDNALRGYTDTMQTLLINRICNKQKASELKRREDFHNLDQNLQSFILRIDAGCTKMEDLLRTEGRLTRDHITTEASRTEQSMKAHITNQVHAHEIKALNEIQRERCLRSLKFEEMNQRWNAITDPEDATFNQIFQSLEKTTSRIGELSSRENSGDANSQTATDKARFQSDTEEIDTIWQEFVHWLQSDHPLFWIKGKPGSGKSTLVKYIIQNNATRKLLDQWHPGTKVLSHFFWRIGSPLQNSTRGLYCSLVYQLLQGNQSLINDVIDKFPFIMTKEYHHDWSDRELELVLLAVLGAEADRQPLCIFIDGLDEYSGEDGQGGLVERIKRVIGYDRVKMCVASRPEQRLEDQLSNVPNLKLHDLTCPDMRAYIQEEFRKFERAGQISAQLSSTLTWMILRKAEGVFLWVRLALQSLASGIHNQDSQELLTSRLEQLPNKLEALYADMWKRLNQDEPIYRESAAMYFRFIIQQRGLPDRPALLEGVSKFGVGQMNQLTLFHIVCSSDTKIQERFLDRKDDITYDDETGALCDKLEKHIRTRCAGLVEIRSRIPQTSNPTLRGSPVWKMIKRVDFIHRTAHDFLVDTEAGKQILDHGKMSTAEVDFNMMKSSLCWIRLVSQEFHSWHDIYSPLLTLSSYALGKDKNDWMTWSFEFLPAMQHLYDKGHLSGSRGHWPRPHFLGIAMGWPPFGEYVASSIENVGATMATDILRQVSWHQALRGGIEGPSMKILQRVLSCGAIPAVVGSQTISETEMWLGERKTALWKLLNDFYTERFFVFSEDSYNKIILTAAGFVTAAAAAMLEQFPTTAASDNWGLVAPAVVGMHGTISRGGLSFLDRFNMTVFTPIFEVNMSFLLKQVLNYLSTSDATEPMSRAQYIHDQITNPVGYIRFIAFENPTTSSYNYFRVIDQLPLESIISLMFNVEDNSQRDFQRWYETVISLLEDPDVLQPVELEDIWKIQANAERLGYCTLKDAGFAWSDRLGRPVSVT